VEPEYLFVFGNAPELAEEELTAVLPAGRQVYPNFDLLGGTVKIAEIFSGPIFDQLIKNKKLGERIVFGLSGVVLFSKSKEIKAELEEKGYKARFVLPAKGEVELSSVVVAKQKVTEIYFIGDLTAKTCWVQDFEEWNKRDYGRPGVDAHIGMLPPKVARMMVNVAGPGIILDPFCGVGTVLAEAYSTDHKIIGADINGNQIDKTKKNLDWMGAKYELFQHDARTISQKITPNSVDAIVTEPYLGPDDPKKLEQLYLDSLVDWQKILKPGGKVIIALPFHIDKAKIMGYSLLAGPFPYFRPQAKIKRNIYVFTRN